MDQKSAIIAISHSIVNAEKALILYEGLHGGPSIMQEELIKNSNSKNKPFETILLVM